MISVNRTVDSSHGRSSAGEKSTKRRYCLWTLTLILAIISLCNLFLNIAVIAVLRICQGMEAMEVIPDENLVKFYGRTDLDKVLRSLFKPIRFLASSERLCDYSAS